MEATRSEAGLTITIAGVPRRGGVKLGGDVGVGVRHRHLAEFDAVEHEGGRLPGPDGDARADVAAVEDLERVAGREAEPELRRAKQRAVWSDRDVTE
jgi:hypothetical protein